MKKYKITLPLFLVFAFVSLITKAQVSNNVNTQNRKDLSLSEYTALKKQGALSQRYEYRIDNGATTLVNMPSRSLLPTTAAALTPCDVLPTQGGVGYSVETDDSPLLTIPLQFNFCFYGTNYSSLNLSANGNVQFSTNSTSFNATGFPSTAVNMIAPFWADAESMVSSGGYTYGKIYIDTHPTYMIITWDSMGYFNNHVDKLNSFQLVLTNGLDPILPAGKNVGFFYKKMEWTTGDASGGTNGFPTIQPGTPATIGANQGNGVDYFLIGQFGVPGSIYDGPLGNSDGVSWLDGKKFFFNACPPIGANKEPVSTLIGVCDTIKVCGNDTLIIKNAFIGPEITQTVSLTASAPSLGSSFSYSVLQTGNNTDISMSVDGSTAPAGNHIVTMSATDNGTPALTSIQNFVVLIDPSSVNNLNGQIVFTPTLGTCPGGAISASVTVSGGVPSSYLWNNNASTTSTGFTITPALDSTVYVTVTSGQCQKTFKNYIRVNPVPVASITGNASLCSVTNSTSVLTASNTLNFAAQAPYTYTWTSSQTPPSPTNTQTTTATAGTYSVVITNRYNCKSSASITLTLSPTPVFTVVPSTNTTICVGTALSLNLNLSNTPPSSCGLSGSGGCSSPNQITIGTGNVLNTSTSYPSIYGHYYKNARHQLIYTASELTAMGIVPGKLSSIAFMVTSIPAGYVGSIPGLTIKMKCTQQSDFVGSTNFDNAGLTQVYNVANYVPVVGWNQHNFTGSYEWDGSSNLLVDVCYSLNLGPVFTTNPIMPSTTTSAARCLYDRDDTSPLCGAAGGFFMSSTTNRPNTKFGNCQVSNPSLFSYTWTPNTNIAPINTYSAIANPTITTIYTVQVENNANTNCRQAQSVTVTVLNPVTPTITAINPLCTNASPLNFTVNPSGGTWAGSGVSAAGLLSPSLTQQGTHTYTYTLGAGVCPTTGTTSVDVTKFVPATITGTVGPYCIYDAAEDLQATAQYTGGVWSGNGVAGTTFTPSVAGAGTHTITYSTDPTPSGLCPDQQTLTIVVNAKPEVNALTDKTQGCNPITINFHTTSVASGNASWDFGDGSPSENGLTSSHTYTNPGTYTATITYTDAIGCLDTTSILTAITVYSVPVASFNPSVIETTVVDGQIEFTNNSSVLTTNAYAWDLGGLLTSTNVNESYLFANSGSYVITLTATNAEGCIDDTSLIVVINPDVVLYVPNAFTPGNGDGLNDDFKVFLPPTGVDFSTFNLTVFDRWGEVVYKTNDVNKFWNGSKNNSGSLMKQDVYVWKINFRDERKQYYERVGHVSLLRK